MTQSAFICGLCQGPELREFETDQVPWFRQPQKPLGRHSVPVTEHIRSLRDKTTAGGHLPIGTDALLARLKRRLSDIRSPQMLQQTPWRTQAACLWEDAEGSCISASTTLDTLGAVAMCLAFDQAFYIADPILSSQLHGSHFTEF